jgi:hypothetical protein
MPTWILIVAFLSIGVTALLASVLRRINTRQERSDRDSSPVLADSGGRSGRSRTDNDADGSHDGGGDGGGGDGGGD